MIRKKYREMTYMLMRCGAILFYMGKERVEMQVRMRKYAIDYQYTEYIV